MLYAIFILALPFSSASISSFFGKEVQKIENTVNPFTKCYKELGCFPIGHPYTSKQCLLLPPPERPEDVNTQIYLYTRKDLTARYTPRLWPSIDMQGSDFNASREQTIFIVHGFIETGNKSWLQEMKTGLLQKYDANVFLVDWGFGAVSLSYYQGVSNTRIVGAEVARFINHLVDHYGLSAEKIHIIGHSLGAQIAAAAAKLFKRVFQKGIAQITALDPAQPCFEETTKEVHLHKSDADYVQVFHTDARPFFPKLGFGMMKAVGDVDFYINGGRNQPMCTNPETHNVVNVKQFAAISMEEIAKLVSCSHQSSVKYYIASIHAPCKMWGYKIENIDNLFNYLNDNMVERPKIVMKRCTGETCVPIGPDAIHYRARGIFNVQTTNKPPFCDTSDPTYDQRIQDAIEKD